MKNIKIIEFDITKAVTDAIVNAANPKMLGGGGVDDDDEPIHKAAAPPATGSMSTNKTEIWDSVSDG